MFRKSCNYHYIKHWCDTMHICCNWFDVIEQYHIQNNKIRLPNTTLNIIYSIERISQEQNLMLKHIRVIAISTFEIHVSHEDFCANLHKKCKAY